MKVKEVFDESSFIILKMTAKGVYYWEIAVSGDDIEKLSKINDKMLTKYPENVMKKQDEIDTPDI